MSRILSFFTSGIIIAATGSALPARAAQLPCDAEGALATKITTQAEDGIFQITEGYRLRLANLVWPDHLEPGLRAQLTTRITAALKDQSVTWKPAAGPDRWGVTPAHLFLQEPGGALAPFWLQAGLVEAGVLPAWPEPADSACWARLAEHETLAIKARRGYWAPRAQAARHRVIEAAREAHAGRRLAVLWRVKSVRPWRSMHFVNFAPSFRGGPSLGLTRRQVSQFGDAQKNPLLWQGKWIVARFIVGSGGLSRIRVDTTDHIGLID